MKKSLAGEADRPAWDLGRVWAAPDPKMLKASHYRSKTFSQLVVTIQYDSKMLETPSSDLSRR
jgi:hypothetical protein